MRVLIIDNGTKYLRKIRYLLKNIHVDVVKWSKLDPRLLNNYDLVILSGGRPFSVVGNNKLYMKEIELIKKFQKPIIGICFGFELIAYTFGAYLEKKERKERGIISIKILYDHPLFHNLPNFKVFENHRWVIKKLPDSLIGLAKSKDGMEIFKHKTRPIYGFQFHPEMFVEKTCGDEIFKNVFNLLLKTA